MSDILICPYCNENQTDDEPDNVSSHYCSKTCGSCGKTFWYSVEVERSYSSWESVED